MTMTHCNFYIDGAWVEPLGAHTVHPVVSPGDEAVVGEVMMGSADDANRAVAAARHAFEGFSQTTLAHRTELLQKLQAAFERRYTEMAQALSTEMGAPWDWAYDAQAECGPGHIKATLEAAKDYPWESRSGPNGELLCEPIGVCVLITPWNWPLNQIVSKLAPALLAGCTVVLKPSEYAPLSGKLVAEFVHEAGYPAGVFNMLYGDGPHMGPMLSGHPEVDFISFTGSTAAGISVAKHAADTVKRVVQELGGKSPNIIFADSKVDKAVRFSVNKCMSNTGQSCNAPTRLLVERSVYAEALQHAAEAGAKVQVIHSADKGKGIGPLASKRQWETVQRYIQIGIEEGAQLLCGGLGRPQGMDKGYNARPTVFGDVNNQMRIAREEIFGPVLVIIPFDTEEEAIAIANDTPYGLAAYIQCADVPRAKRVARRLRAGMVSINGQGQDYCSPFGGYKQSGNGREWGRFGLQDYLEYKVINCAS
jgi:aldehyde dehydrogenase (NAD+)